MMPATTSPLVILVFMVFATVADSQEVVRFAAGARLTESAPPGSVVNATISISNPSGSISGTLSASVSRGPAVITRELRQSVLEAKINNASFIISTNEDVEALAKGLQFEADKRDERLAKSIDRLNDADVVAIKAIAKSALDTEDAVKLAQIMVESTIGNRDFTLEAEFAELLSDRGLMTAILFANPTKEFVPDEDLEDADEDVYDKVLEDEFGESAPRPSTVIRAGNGRSSSPLARSTSSAFVQGDGVATSHGSTLVGASTDDQPITPLITTFMAPDAGRRRRKLMCDACSPVNSFVCAHCWPARVCVNYAWCKRAARNSRRSRRNRRRNRNRGR